MILLDIGGVVWDYGQADKRNDLRGVGMTGMEQRIELNYLLDFYGPLLTENRREILRLYCEEDLSLAEIADQLEIPVKYIGVGEQVDDLMPFEAQPFVDALL
mgnify:CR=1 FL=1